MPITKDPVDLDAAHSEAPDRHAAMPVPRRNRRGRWNPLASQGGERGHDRIVARITRDGLEHLDDQAFRRDPGCVEIPCDLFCVVWDFAGPGSPALTETVIDAWPAWSHAFAGRRWRRALSPCAKASMRPACLDDPEKPDRSQEGQVSGCFQRASASKPCDLPVRASICGWNHARCLLLPARPVRHRTSCNGVSFRLCAIPPRRPDGAWAGDLRLPQCLVSQPRGSRSAAIPGHRSEVQRVRCKRLA
jgi:hypothetical protein